MPRRPASQILTVADLMERWSVDREVVLRLTDAAEYPLPAIPIGEALRKRDKTRSKLRYRLEAVEGWEVETERRSLPRKSAGRT